MKLRTQLLVIAAVVLVLPLAGWQFVTSLEQSLRSAHERSVVDSATAIGRVLAARSNFEWPSANEALYVHASDVDIHLDGHDGEWSPWLDEAQPLDPDNPSLQASVTAVRNRAGLHLLLTADDRQLVFGDRERGHGDRVELRFEDRSGTNSGVTDALTLAPLAPGTIEQESADGRYRIRGNWQPHREGWTLEMQVAGRGLPQRIAIGVVDVDDERQTRNRVESGWLTLIGPVQALQRELAERLPDNSRAWLTSAEGWVLAHADRGSVPGSGSQTMVFETLLGDRLPEREPRDRFTARIPPADDIRDSTTRWVASQSGPGMTVVVSTPVVRDGETIGRLVLERDADEFLVQANQAVIRLFASSLAGVGVIALLLLGFAAVVSERIRRLRDSAEQAVAPDGRVHNQLEAPRARDEIGDLGRSLSELIDRQQAHQDYLRTLADKLAHELRTPIAMVRSSLDNLAETDDPAESRRYRERASAGCRRLNRILQAMSQSARVEESLAREEHETIDLDPLLENYVEGCRSTYPAHRFRLERSRPAPAAIRGSADLIAQLLDKLVENAVDFTPEGQTIVLRLAGRGSAAVIQVDNPGPPLPGRLTGRLFESMVSEREHKGDDVHLGLGLHVARLIARHHGGRIRAANRPGGCRFEVSLPAAGNGRDQEPP